VTGGVPPPRGGIPTPITMGRGGGQGVGIRGGRGSVHRRVIGGGTSGRDGGTANPRGRGSGVSPT
jgi:hypothetical protein